MPSTFSPVLSPDFSWAKVSEAEIFLRPLCRPLLLSGTAGRILCHQQGAYSRHHPAPHHPSVLHRERDHRRRIQLRSWPRFSQNENSRPRRQVPCPPPIHGQVKSCVSYQSDSYLQSPPQSGSPCRILPRPRREDDPKGQ